MEPAIDRVKGSVYGELEALTEVAKVLVSAIELSDLLDTVMQTIVGVLKQANIGAIMLWDQAAGVFRAPTAFGYNLEILRKIDLREGESITGKVFQSGEATFFSSSTEVIWAMENMRPYNREIMAQAIGSEQLPQTAIAAPITAGDRRFGVLVLEALDPRTDTGRSGCARHGSGPVEETRRCDQRSTPSRALPIRDHGNAVARAANAFIHD
jgi:transcriptional regulator with GAF, ATPase, and Fis domain